jgi:hypothetical protein
VDCSVADDADEESVKDCALKEIVEGDGDDVKSEAFCAGIATRNDARPASKNRLRCIADSAMASSWSSKYACTTCR